MVNTQSVTSSGFETVIGRHCISQVHVCFAGSLLSADEHKVSAVGGTYVNLLLQLNITTI